MVHARVESEVLESIAEFPGSQKITDLRSDPELEA